MQRCKEIVDKYSKNFIDLGSDNPHYGDEEGNNKERIYKNLLYNKKVFDNLSSTFFTSMNGNNTNFDHLGNSEPKLNKYEIYMTQKLNEITKKIKHDIPNGYRVDDITVKIDIARI